MSKEKYILLFDDKAFVTLGNKTIAESIQISLDQGLKEAQNLSEDKVLDFRNVQ